MTIDNLLIARVLLTLMTLGWSLATLIADFNKTHATNPLWTPHARFHVVWQVSSYAGLGLLNLALIWWPGALGFERLCLAAAIGVIVFAAFYIAVFTMPVGGAYDSNGHAPFDAPVPLFAKKWDMNITVVTFQLPILIGGIVALTR